MIHRFTIRQKPNGYTTISEDRLVSPTEARRMADSLYPDGFWGEAFTYDKWANQGRPVWEMVGSVGGCGLDMPDKARRKVTRKDRRAIENGQTVTVYACLY